jgi:single-strand DNA-binding protein
MNSWNFVGNLGRDAEVRFTPAGDAITNFSVAVKAGYGKNEVTSWVNCSMFGDRGQKVAQYIKKGNQIAVNGEGLLRTWDAKDGTKQSSLECRVNNVTLLGGKKDIESGEAQSQDMQSNGQNNGFDDIPDDIPF